MRRKLPLPSASIHRVARGAAAIALPARRIGGVAADHHRVAGAEREVVDLAERQQLRHAAGGVERERAIVAEERLAVRGHEQDAGRRASSRAPCTSGPSHVMRRAGPPSAGIR